MIGQKKLTWLLLIIICILFIVGIYLTYTLNKYKDNKVTLNKINEDLINTMEFEYYNSFAGSYLDENGLNINLVKGANAEEIKVLNKYNAIIHYVDFSLTDLNKIISILSEKMKELDIEAVGLDERENKVIVYLDGIDEVKIEKIKSVSNSTAIEFKDQKLKFSN